MNQNLDASADTLRDALYVLSTAKDLPDAKLLDDLIRCYPQFGEELTQFAIAVAVDALRGDRAIEAAEAALDPSVVSPGVSRAMSRFQNRLYTRTAGTSPAQATTELSTRAIVENPFAALPRKEFRALAARLNANTVFVCKLRDRQIDPRTMSPSFLPRIAEELKAPLEVVVAHFGASQVAPTSQFFKAEDKPSAIDQQTFEEAVRTSGLSEAQQRALLEL